MCVQEKAGADVADTDVSKPQELQFPSLENALKTDWSSLHPRRSHKLICLLAGDPTGPTAALLRHAGCLLKPRRCMKMQQGMCPRIVTQGLSVGMLRTLDLLHQGGIVIA